MNYILLNEEIIWYVNHISLKLVVLRDLLKILACALVEADWASLEWGAGPSEGQLGTPSQGLMPLSIGEGERDFLFFPGKPVLLLKLFTLLDQAHPEDYIRKSSLLEVT